MMGPWIKETWTEQLRPMLSRLKYLAGGPRRLLQRISLHPIAWLFGGPAPAITKLHELYPLTPERILAGYAQGIFPTGEKDDTICWHCPPIRAVIPADQVHISKRLKGYLRKDRFQIRFDQDFESVVRLCADRDNTWITPRILTLYRSLYEMRFAHSVEAYVDNQLVGGGYGVALGNVFFLESMFCREDHASKVAFVRLAEKLQRDGYEAIDCQFMTEHWRRFGAREMAHEKFQRMVVKGLHQPAQFSTESTTAVVTIPLTATETFATR